MQFFLKEENKEHWSRVQSLAAANDDQTLRLYVCEAMRLTSAQRNLRIATQAATFEGKNIKPGEAVLLLLGTAGRDPKTVPDANKFVPTRKQDGLLTPFSTGPHECFGRTYVIPFIVGMVKLLAGLKDLRPAPGLMGAVKTIQIGSERCYLNDSWSWLSFDAASKFHPL
jgi:cytochrome P450